MSLDVAPIRPAFPSAAADGARGRRPVAAVAAPAADDGIPSVPPPEVLEAIDAASRAYRTLQAQGRELRFAVDEASGRVTVEVRDLYGNVLRTIPPSEALDVATGAELA